MLKMFKNLTKKEILFFIISVVFIVIGVFADLKIPDYMQEITILVQTEGNAISDILVQGGYMLGCAFISLIAAVIVGYFAAYIGTSFERHLRSKIFNKVSDFGMEEIKNFSTSSLITRSTNDVTQVKMFVVMAIQMLIKAPIMAIVAVGKIVGKGWEFSLITLVGVLIVLAMVIVLVILVLPKFKKVQKLMDKINGLTRENLTGIRVIRAYNAEDYQQEKFEVVNDELNKTQIFNQKTMALMSPIMSTIMSGLSLAIYWVGAYLINEAAMLDKMTIFGNMVTFSSYAVQVIMSFVMLVMLFIIYPRASVSARRLNEVLDTEPHMVDGTIDEDTTDLRGEVEFKDVFFKYPDAEEYILENISFTAHKGETIAFIGSTGSGKSTLINLIPRFYDATDGEILIDGVDVKKMKREYLNDKLGYISQKAVMFKGSIKENVTLGQVKKGKPNDKKIEDAIRVAQASEFITKMPEGIKTEISQGGTNISGGQKQRLSIARAIARDPEIYIFDDSFSALDYKTDFALREDLKKYTKDATVLIVAQRIGTIKDADKIVVLDRGKCVGIGTHRELLSNCEIYKEIASSQLSEEELKNA
ncbi:MAG TPA: multidrug ABC transporter ATP-binding protein [Firmicutes bacterium]|nr:multidrug ABC transporter ATP-binding protein [Bacillota bacterium]